MTPTLRLARGKGKHQKYVIGLIDDAAAWLRLKDTNQWEEPWPDRVERDARVRRGLDGGKTWLVWDDSAHIAAATVTVARQANPKVWPPSACLSRSPAVYIHRLVTRRTYAGLGIGAELIDWVGLRAAEQYGAESIRIDVWTSNRALHEYYEKRGFVYYGNCTDPTYPSGALFQKPIADIEPRNTGLLVLPADVTLK
jgi:GNAT superfamily N-acetyltransferase